MGIKDINTFNYILLFIDKENNLLVHFYSCINSLDKNILFSKRKITLNEDKKSLRSLFENDLQCQLISNYLFCFFSKGINDEIVLEKFSFSFEERKIKLLNFIKPEKNLNFNGKIIKSLVNKDQSRILILYSMKDNKSNKIQDKYAIYNIISDELEFPSEINEALYNHNIYSNLVVNSKSNMDYIKSMKKYVLYCLNERNELLIVELKEDFKKGNITTYILDRKSENF